MELVHAVVGIPLPRDVTQALEKAQGGIAVGRPVAAKGMHIGLADLGEHLGPGIQAVREKLHAVEVGPFYLKIEGLGTRGGQAPTEVYAEVEAASKLKELHKMVGRAVRLAGVELSHERFTPGAAMVRFTDLAQHDLKQIMSFLSRRAGLSAGPFPVTDFALYAVKDDGRAIAHEVIETYELSGR